MSIVMVQLSLNVTDDKRVRSTVRSLRVNQQYCRKHLASGQYLSKYSIKKVITVCLYFSADLALSML